MSTLFNSTQEKLVRNVASVAKRSLREPNYWGWPPDCVGIFYQAKRPTALRKEDNLHDNTGK